MNLKMQQQKLSTLKHGGKNKMICGTTTNGLKYIQLEFQEEGKL